MSAARTLISTTLMAAYTITHHNVAIDARRCMQHTTYVGRRSCRGTRLYRIGERGDTVYVYRTIFTCPPLPTVAVLKSSILFQASHGRNDCNSSHPWARHNDDQRHDETSNDCGIIQQQLAATHLLRSTFGEVHSHDVLVSQFIPA